MPSVTLNNFIEFSNCPEAPDSSRGGSGRRIYFRDFFASRRATFMIGLLNWKFEISYLKRGAWDQRDKWDKLEEWDDTGKSGRRAWRHPVQFRDSSLDNIFVRF